MNCIVSRIHTKYLRQQYISQKKLSFPLHSYFETRQKNIEQNKYCKKKSQQFHSYMMKHLDKTRKIVKRHEKS